MKSFRISLIAFVAALGLAACQKVDSTMEQPVLETPTSPEEIEVVEYTAQEFASLFEGVEVPPETRCAALSYEIAKIKYTSVSGNGEPVTLSMKVSYPKGILTKYHDPEYILLDNHPTILSEAESPWSCNPIALSKALDDALVVSPDYEGYGISSDRDHPYLAHDLNARQSVDAALAAVDYINAKKGIKMEKGYHLENYGYSQGGGIALAVHKYIENNLSIADQKKLNLEKTYCGGGPYDPKATMEVYFHQDELEYPSLLPMVLIGYMCAYPDVFKGVALEDFFSEKFLASGTIEMIRSKQYKNNEVNAHIRKTVGSSKCSDIFKPEVFDPQSTYRLMLEECFVRSNLTTGWAPVKKVTMMHSAKDQIVPAVNAINAYEGIKSGNISEVKWAPLSPEHIPTGVLFYLDFMGLKIIPGALGHFLD